MKHAQCVEEKCDLAQKQQAEWEKKARAARKGEKRKALVRASLLPNLLAYLPACLLVHVAFFHTPLQQRSIYHCNVCHCSLWAKLEAKQSFERQRP